MTKTNRPWRAVAVAATLLVTATGVLAVGPTQSGAAVVSDTNVFGLTAGGRLVQFDQADPGTILMNRAVTGLLSPLVGIDVRPATGQLYGITSGGQIVTIDETNGSTRTVSNLTGAVLTGTAFGVDFNPVPDRLRVVSDTGQNLRINVDTGAALVDGPLAYDVADVNAAAVPNIVAAAYANNVAGATTTTLYTVDSDLDTINIQNPPNNGTQVTQGPIGLDVSDLTGLDISGSGAGLAVASGVDGNVLYNASLGVAVNGFTPIGVIGKGNLGVVDIAAVAGPTSVMFATTSANQLLTFDRSNPELGRIVGTISGTVGGSVIAAIDFRPATGSLYGLAFDGRLYTIDPTTAIATQVGATQVPLLAGRIDIDFNPTVDRIRVVTNTKQNLRVNPDTGAVAVVDTALAYAAGDPNFGVRPSVTAAGYTNSVAGAVATTLYDIDTTTDALLIQTPPNNGTLTTVGSLGVDARTRATLDIINPTTAVSVLDMATASGSILHSIDLVTGAATYVGPVRAGGKSVTITSIAVQPAA